MAQDTQLDWDGDGRRAGGQARAEVASSKAVEVVGVGPSTRPMASNSGRDKMPSPATRARSPRRDSGATRASSRDVSPRRSLVTPSTLRRTRVSGGIRAALDRATRTDAVPAPLEAGRSPRSGNNNRTTKYIQEDGTRAGRWRDLGGRFTTPPSPHDEVITQAEAISRRASLAASSATAES